jgi:hypothetical protein
VVGVLEPLGPDDALLVLDGLAPAPVVDGVVPVPNVDEPPLKLLELGVLLKLPYAVSWSPPIPSRSRPKDCQAQ